VRPAPRRFEEVGCGFCKRVIRVPRHQRGWIVRCPSCRFFNPVPGRPHPDSDGGLPVVVRVSAYFLGWPDACACCLALPDTEAAATCMRFGGRDGVPQEQVRRNKFFYVMRALGEGVEWAEWKIPYCWECLEHVERKTDRAKRACCGLDAAVVYGGWYASTHTFRFYNWRYANAFILLNRDKCLL
jgi:hypothetical protein